MDARYPARGAVIFLVADGGKWTAERAIFRGSFRLPNSGQIFGLFSLDNDMVARFSEPAFVLIFWSAKRFRNSEIRNRFFASKIPPGGPNSDAENPIESLEFFGGSGPANSAFLHRVQRRISRQFFRAAPPKIRRLRHEKGPYQGYSSHPAGWRTLGFAAPPPGT
jgi:hypothetical protein